MWLLPAFANFTGGAMAWACARRVPESAALHERRDGIEA
jgi:hypothetical protein